MPVGNIASLLMQTDRRLDVTIVSGNSAVAYIG